MTHCKIDETNLRQTNNEQAGLLSDLRSNLVHSTFERSSFGSGVDRHKKLADYIRQLCCHNYIRETVVRQCDAHIENVAAYGSSTAQCHRCADLYSHQDMTLKLRVRQQLNYQEKAAKGPCKTQDKRSYHGPLSIGIDTRSKSRSLSGVQRFHHGVNKIH